MPVRVGNVSGLQSAMVIDDVVDVSFICRHCKWEQAQSDVIERLVSVEKISIRLTEESVERNARLDRIEENNRRLVELKNEIDTQQLQLGIPTEPTGKMRK